ncbi:MAG: DUF2332 family protein, partial [Pseudomonadota bacterium]|nr:DUF2332 family protein [Pseudomonadota bacterium]
RLRLWPGDPRPSGDAVPLRLCGGLHASVRAGNAPSLATCYPPNALPERERLAAAVSEAMRASDLVQWLDRPPQTNEVGRANALFSGLLAFADRFPQPVALFELGASAGLNLNMDRFGYDLGGLHTGDPASPLQLRPAWTGPSPPEARIEVLARRGVDLTPLDALSEGERLRAFVWADQVRRIEQLGAALEVARAHPPLVDSGDAAAWLEARLDEAQPRATGRLVYHSIAFQYFPPNTQARVKQAIEGAGDKATGQTPLGWLRFERTPDEQDPTLRLRMWPGNDDRLLATCHPHGTSINWLAGAPAR